MLSTVFEGCLGVQRMFFKTLGHHIIHSSNMIDGYGWHQKSSKIAKNAIFAENSNFQKMFLSVPKHHIWSKMRTRDVLKVFPTHIRFLNTFLKDFRKIDFFSIFLKFFFVGPESIFSKIPFWLQKYHKKYKIVFFVIGTLPKKIYPR